MLHRRKADQPNNGQSARELARPAELAEYPDLWEFLTSRWWAEDRRPRETGTLLIFVEGGDRKIMLNDRDAHVLAFVTVQDGQSVFAAAEDALSSPKTDWRAPKNPSGGGPRRLERT